MNAVPDHELLDIVDLEVSFSTLRGRVQVLDRISLSATAGEIVGVVGESGSGKSVTALAVMRLLGEQGRIDTGAIHFGGRDLALLDAQAMRGVRGREISMIFQEPMTSLNPLYTVGFQVAEVLMEHVGLSSKEAYSRAVDQLDAVGIPAARHRAASFPHQLSGGMRQRVMIAMALACRPQLLIADEPTTALDVTIQAQILALIRTLRDELGTAVLMITHDMGVIADIADRVVVMYAGQVVEEAPVTTLFDDPRHPYARLLLRSIPLVSRRQSQLPVVPGTTPGPSERPTGCRFHPRCPDAIDRCRTIAPALELHVEGHRVRCWRHAEVGLESEPAR